MAGCDNLGKHCSAAAVKCQGDVRARSKHDAPLPVVQRQPAVTRHSRNGQHNIPPRPFHADVDFETHHEFLPH